MGLVWNKSLSLLRTAECENFQEALKKMGSLFFHPENTKKANLLLLPEKIDINYFS